MSTFATMGTTGSEAEAPRKCEPRLIPAALIFAALYVGAFAVSGVESISKPIRIVIAILPVPAFLYFLILWVRNIRRLDELECRVQLESLAVAFPLTLVLVMALGLLQRVTVLDPADWSYPRIWPILFAFYFFGLVLARRRYK
jgi:hypothetical protein